MYSPLLDCAGELVKVPPMASRQPLGQGGAVTYASDAPARELSGASAKPARADTQPGMQ